MKEIRDYFLPLETFNLQTFELKFLLALRIFSFLLYYFVLPSLTKILVHYLIPNKNLGTGFNLKRIFFSAKFISFLQ